MHRGHSQNTTRWLSQHALMDARKYGQCFPRWISQFQLMFSIQNLRVSCIFVTIYDPHKAVVDEMNFNHQARLEQTDEPLQLRLT